MPSPRQIAWAKFRALVVTLAASAILIVLFYLFTGGTLFQSKAMLYVYVPDASGVGPGSPVQVDGINIGKVSSVRLSGSNQPARVVRVTMSVAAEHLADIPIDSIAEVGNATLLGDEFIGIRSGRSATHVRTGAEITLKPQTTSLDLTQFAAELRTVDATLREIQTGASPLGQFVLGDDMYRNLVRRLVSIQKGLNALSSTTSEIGGLLYTDKLYRQIDTPLISLDQTLTRLQDGQGPMGRMLRDPQQYDQLQSAMADLRRSVAAFRGAPLVSSDAAYNQWSRSLESLVRRVDELNSNPLFLSTSTYDNGNGFALSLRNTVRDFRENPRKYLRLKLF